jgi:hypothetical protein
MECPVYTITMCTKENRLLNGVMHRYKGASVMAEQDKGGWGEFKQLFLRTLDDFDKLRDDVVQLKIEQAVIKVKLFLWGAAGASMATALFNFLIWFINGKSSL